MQSDIGSKWLNALSLLAALGVVLLTGEVEESTEARASVELMTARGSRALRLMQDLGSNNQGYWYLVGALGGQTRSLEGIFKGR